MLTEQQFARVRQHVLDAIDVLHEQPQITYAEGILQEALDGIDALKPTLVKPQS